MEISEINGNAVIANEAEAPDTGKKFLTVTVSQPLDWHKTSRKLGGVVGRYVSRRFKSSHYRVKAVRVELKGDYVGNMPVWSATYRLDYSYA